MIPIPTPSSLHLNFLSIHEAKTSEIPVQIQQAASTIVGTIGAINTAAKTPVIGFYITSAAPNTANGTAAPSSGETTIITAPETIPVIVARISLVLPFVSFSS